MNILGIIPSRYESRRFPGKALVDIKGMTMVERVYQQARKAKYLQKVIVATDNQQIFDHVKEFDGEVMITDPGHSSGTERCAEVIENDLGFDFVINIQGDEPLIDPGQIDVLCQSLKPDTQVGTLVKKIEDQESLISKNVVKVVINNDREALYFSRHPIPFYQEDEIADWLKHQVYYKHIGIYAYRTDILKKYPSLPKTSLEKAESLEQLRWLYHGFKIQVAETEMESIGVDTPQDLVRVLQLL